LCNKVMKITTEQKKQLEEIYQTLLNDDKVKQMKEIPMHRGSNCYEHCFMVAKRAIKRSQKFYNKKVKLEVVLIGAILHDYYLYDWRKDRSKLKHHGTTHQYVASANATRDFNISPEVKKVIEAHMWPMNFKEFPNTKEARIVSWSDKAIAIKQSLTSKKHKNKKRSKYEKYISHLF